jgi:polysaccharide export outer membrane protein
MQKLNPFSYPEFETYSMSRTTALDGLWFSIQRLIAALILFLLLPLLGILYVLVKTTSKGPFIYSQERLGLNGDTFKTYKIRSMVVGADREKSFARSVQSSNPCVTTIGSVLRDLKLDEIPQLWNIIKGDMVFVGPRPIAIPLQRELEQTIDGFDRRLSIPPGLTNLGQVCILESASQDRVVEDWRMRFEAELHYMQNRKPSYDILILLITVLYIARKLISSFHPFRWYSPRFALVSVSLLALLFLSGCSSVPTTTSPNSAVVSIQDITKDSDMMQSEIVNVQSVTLDTAIQEEPELHYRVGIGDTLLINVFEEPGMNNLRIPVDADGHIQLPFDERAHVLNKTTAEIQSQLKSIFSKSFKDPWILVLVENFGSRPLYLLGEFNSPGVIYLDRPTNIIQALGHGMGLSEHAYLRGARLLRKDQLVPVDINGLLKEGRQDQNLWLQAGDTIFVPNIKEQKIIVLGAVNKPKTLSINNGGIGLTEVITEAEGIRRGIAKLDQIRVIRSLSAVSGEFITINAEKIFTGSAPDFPLQPGDIVYVPQNALGDWNDVVSAIKPSFELVSTSLQPFVQLKFLTEN